MSYIKLSFAKLKVVENRGKIIGFIVLCLMIFCFFALDLVVRIPILLESINHVFATYEFIAACLGLLLSLLVSLLISFIVYCIWNIIEKKIDSKMAIYERDWKNADKGVQGEMLVLQELKKNLDKSDYQIHQDVTLPNLESDLDFVVVSVKGIILIEVKNYEKSKDIYDAKSSYYKSKDGKLIKNQKDLRKIVSWRAEKIEQYLAEKGLDNIKVRKVVLYVKSDSVEIKEYGMNKNHVYIVPGLNKLQDYLASAKPDNRFTLNQCSKVNDILKKL